MARSAEVSFGWINHKYSREKPLSWKLDTLAGVCRNCSSKQRMIPSWPSLRRKLFKSAPEPKEQVTIPHGNFVDMEDADKRAYENRVVSYFLLRLPATGHR